MGAGGETYGSQTATQTSIRTCPVRTEIGVLSDQVTSKNYTVRLSIPKNNGVESFFLKENFDYKEKNSIFATDIYLYNIIVYNIKKSL